MKNKNHEHVEQLHWQIILLSWETKSYQLPELLNTLERQKCQNRGSHTECENNTNHHLLKGLRWAANDERGLWGLCRVSSVAHWNALLWDIYKYFETKILGSVWHCPSSVDNKAKLHLCCWVASGGSHFVCSEHRVSLKFD